MFHHARVAGSPASGDDWAEADDDDEDLRLALLLSMIMEHTQAR